MDNYEFTLKKLEVSWHARQEENIHLLTSKGDLLEQGMEKGKTRVQFHILGLSFIEKFKYQQLIEKPWKKASGNF